MKDQSKFIHSAQLYVEAATLYNRTFLLRRSVVNCEQQLWENHPDKAMVSELEDQIFGYRIEYESLLVRIDRLTDQARLLHLEARGFQSTAPVCKRSFVNDKVVIDFSLNHDMTLLSASKP